MVTEWDKIIDFVNYITKPENLQVLIAIISIVVSALTTIVVKVIMYLLKRRTIPKLVFDGEYKTNSIGGITYFLKVKRDKGEGS